MFKDSNDTVAREPYLSTLVHLLAMSSCVEGAAAKVLKRTACDAWRKAPLAARRIASAHARVQRSVIRELQGALIATFTAKISTSTNNNLPLHMMV